jgi:hypothetical protein
MASATDAQVQKSYEESKAGFDLLGLSRAELSAKIPVSDSSSVLEANPAVQKVKGCMEQLDAIKI